MSYKTHAHLKPTATATRVKALVRDLKFYGCTTHVHYGAKRIDVELADHLERWIVLGGLARLLESYNDVVGWHPNFTHEAVLCHALSMLC
jgi:hypothetical protein